MSVFVCSSFDLREKHILASCNALIAMLQSMHLAGPLLHIRSVSMFPVTGFSSKRYKQNYAHPKLSSRP